MDRLVYPIAYPGLGELISLPTVMPLVEDFAQGFFPNKVDHYNFQSNDTYMQRYWVNDKYCED